MSESSPHAASRGFSSLKKKLILACPPPNMLGLLSTRLGYLEKQIAVECCKLSPVSTKVAASTLPHHRLPRQEKEKKWLLRFKTQTTASARFLLSMTLTTPGSSCEPGSRKKVIAWLKQKMEMKLWPGLKTLVRI